MNKKKLEKNSVRNSNSFRYKLLYTRKLCLINKNAGIQSVQGFERKVMLELLLSLSNV